MRALNPGPGPHDYSATLRQLKVLVVVLVLSNVGLGMFAVYLLRSTDERYSTLLDRSIPTLNDFRELTADMADALRATGTPLLEASASDRAEMARRAMAAIARDRQFRGTVIKDPLPPTTADYRAKISEVGDRFDRSCEQIVTLATTDRLPEALRIREQLVRGAFNDYVGVIGQSGEAIEAASLRASSEVSARTGNMANVVLGLAGWPVIVLLALLVLTALFVVVLMVLFRGREMSEVP